jgi:hypothetical protein
MWPEPVLVESQQLYWDQPSLVPVLTFACQEYVRQSDNSARNQVSLLCLDKRNGRKVFAKSFPVTNMTGTLEIIGDAKQQTVEVRVPQHTVVLTFTDKPLPPPSADPKPVEVPKKGNAASALGRAVGRALGVPLPPDRIGIQSVDDLDIDLFAPAPLAPPQR